MTLPYSSYSELSPQFAAWSPLTEPDIVDNPLIVDNCSLQTLRFPEPEVSYPAPSPLPVQDPLGAFIWDSHSYAYQEHDSFINSHGPLIQFPPDDLAFSPDAYSPAHHVAYPTHSHSHSHSYTRMFRGRKSKPASEVLDELRPYACDICQAAFARSHDRDRHKRSHTGETPYQCHGCGAGFKRPDARKRHWERDTLCAQEDWRRVQHTAEGAKRRARAKGRQLKPIKKSVRL